MKYTTHELNYPASSNPSPPISASGSRISVEKGGPMNRLSGCTFDTVSRFVGCFIITSLIIDTISASPGRNADIYGGEDGFELSRLVGSRICQLLLSGNRPNVHADARRGGRDQWNAGLQGNENGLSGEIFTITSEPRRIRNRVFSFAPWRNVADLVSAATTPQPPIAYKFAAKWRWIPEDAEVLSPLQWLNDTPRTPIGRHDGIWSWIANGRSWEVE